MSDFTDIQHSIETKGRRLIRRVRTPEGADHFGQPIGSIIVRDLPSMSFSVGGRRQRARDAVVPNHPRESVIAAMDTPEAEARKAPEVEEVPTDYEGTRKWKVPGRRGRVYTWEEEPGKWVLADHKDEVLAEDVTEAGVIRAIRDLIPKDKTGAPKRQRAPRKGLVKYRPATDEDLAKLKEVHGINIGPGHSFRHTMEVADREDFWNNEPPLRYTNARNKVQPMYSQAHTDKASRAKFQRIKKLMENIEPLDEYLEANWRTDDSAAALYLMRKTGIRPSSMNNNTGNQATFGVTNLQARHVTLNKDSVRLKFVGKKEVDQDHTYKDPELFEMFTQYSEGKKGREEIFPGANEHKLRAIMKEVMGDEYKVYDLRTLIATQYALQLVAARKRPAAPKTKQELKKWRNEVGDAVSDMLGNKRDEALKSYIDPDVFTKWEEAVSND